MFSCGLIYGTREKACQPDGQAALVVVIGSAMVSSVVRSSLEAWSMSRPNTAPEESKSTFRPSRRGRTRLKSCERRRCVRQPPTWRLCCYCPTFLSGNAPSFWPRAERSIKPRKAKPASTINQLAGSGTDAGTIVAVMLVGERLPEVASVPK